jgi:hypothetical protein
MVVMVIMKKMTILTIFDHHGDNKDVQFKQLLQHQMDRRVGGAKGKSWIYFLTLDR